MPGVTTPIPDGTTWNDSTGRTWTSHGDLELRGFVYQGVRQLLADYLRPLLPDFINVYPYPPDNLKGMALIISLADPAWEKWEQGGPENIVWGLELVLLQSRSQPSYALDRLEQVAALIIPLLKGFPQVDTIEMCEWADFTVTGVTEYGSAEYLTGVVAVGVVAKL